MDASGPELLHDAGFPVGGVAGGRRRKAFDRRPRPAGSFDLAATTQFDGPELGSVEGEVEPHGGVDARAAVLNINHVGGGARGQPCNGGVSASCIIAPNGAGSPRAPRDKCQC